MLFFKLNTANFTVSSIKFQFFFNNTIFNSNLKSSLSQCLNDSYFNIVFIKENKKNKNTESKLGLIK